jgi:hypothetical protein
MHTYPRKSDALDRTFRVFWREKEEHVSVMKYEIHASSPDEKQNGHASRLCREIIHANG